MSATDLIVAIATWGIFGHALTLTVSYLLLTLLASNDLRDVARARRSEPPIDLFSLPLTPPISVLAPAYNEEAGIVESISSLLGLNYPEFEVIVINDGSKDATLEKLTEGFDLEPFDRVLQDALDTQPVRSVYRSPHHPNLVVIDKENGGKADALNVGINAARYPLVCAIDADSVLEADALLKTATPLVHRPDLTIATGGIVRIANGAEFEGGTLVRTGIPRRMLARFQLIEYLRAFIVGRAGWSRLKSLLIVSGAFGVFRRDVVLEVGGYRTDTIGEDLELIVRLHRHMREAGRPYRIEFVPDPVCWTEAPENLRVLRRQRIRWQRGLMETLGIHRSMVFNRRYGRLGTVALPYFVIFELLGPVVETLGLAVILWLAWQGTVAWEYAALLIGVSLAAGFVMSVMALIFEEAAFRRYPRWRQTAALLTFTVLENFGYRQINAWWRLVGLAQGLRGSRAAWGTMTRSGSLGEQSSTTMSDGPTRYWELRRAIESHRTTGDAVPIESAQVAATLDEAEALRVVPFPSPEAGVPSEAPEGRGFDDPEPQERPSRPRRQRDNRSEADRAYTDDVCAEFVEELGIEVLERAEVLFGALWRMGYVDSEQLGELVDCEPSSLAGLITSPISRRAKDLGLPLPYRVNRSGRGGRRAWRNHGEAASRMLIAVRRELALRNG